MRSVACKMEEQQPDRDEMCCGGDRKADCGTSPVHFQKHGYTPQSKLVSMLEKMLSVEVSSLPSLYMTPSLGLWLPKRRSQGLWE